jgi:hypothetical protein
VVRRLGAWVFGALSAAPLLAALPAASSGALNIDLYNATALADGHKLCDRALAVRQHKAFEQRYGRRVQALKDDYARWHGPDEEFIATTSCFNQKSGRALRRERNAFEVKLTNLIKRYERPAGDPK